MSVKVCWRVLRMEAIQEDCGCQDSPWEEIGRTMAVSEAQAINNVRYRFHDGPGGSLWFELPGDGMVWEEWKAEIVDPDMEFSWEDE